MPSKKYLLLLITVIIITIFSRTIEIFNQSNYYFGWEQATEYLVTKSIVVDHQIVLTAHQGGFGGFSKNPGFNYLLIIPFILGNGDPFAGRVFMFGISMLTVLIAFILTNKMFNLKTAWLISFLLAISPSLKDYAQSVSPPFVIPLLTVFFIYILFEIFKEKKNLIPLLVFIVGLMTNFEMATAGVLMVLLLITATYCLVKKSIPYRYYSFSALLFLMNLLPIFIYDIKHNFSNIKGVLKMIQASQNHTANNLILNIGNLINSRISVFGWNFTSTFSSNSIIWLTLLFVIIAGVIIFVKDKKIDTRTRQFILYLGFIPIFTFAFILFYPSNSVQAWWLLDLTVIYCYLLGIVMGYFWQKNNFKFITFIIIFVLSLLFLKRTLFLYRTQLAYPPSTYIKERTAIDYVYSDADKKPFGIKIFPKGSQKIYDYLIWWQAKIKYKYQPSDKNHGLYYIVVDRNSILTANEQNYLNVLRKGKLLKSKILSNNFVIEKRYAGTL